MQPLHKLIAEDLARLHWNESDSKDSKIDSKKLLGVIDTHRHSITGIYKVLRNVPHLFSDLQGQDVGLNPAKTGRTRTKA